LYVWAKLTPASPPAIARIDSFMVGDADHGRSADRSYEVGKKGRVETRTEEKRLKFNEEVNSRWKMVVRKSEWK